MPLFQQSVLKKYVSNLDKGSVQHAWMLFQNHFFNAEIQQNIRNSKEEEYQEGFVRDLFVNVLGYTLNPQPSYNLVLEKKTVADATKSDGAILLNSVVIGVVELKDTGTPDLDKVSNQAFGYKHKHKLCNYVITSNFEKLRLYINDATDFEEFELFTLTQERFAVLYLCLQQQNLLSHLPLTIKQQSVVQEENVTKKLYHDYSAFKTKLFQNIAEQNAQHDKLLLFKKTQKLLDRFLFILFAEDRLLLPPNSIREIMKQWEQLKELDNYVPLYERFKKYFGYLNVGHSGKQHEIFPYNGGLFEPDEVLDSVIIDDTILFTGATSLSKYDYETEVDVNILGHIFEHSLTEIEELQMELEGKPVEKSKTKRKKEGVFYTPRYITKYIVENTVGALCTQKKEELQINEETFSPQKRKDNRKALLEIIEAYRNWLLQLTICDPACGSGAFLNAALEYLKSEHKTLDELTAKVHGSLMVFPELNNQILENNLYGVDINEDAIEIAKLSLWLHTAKKGRKLSNLSNNIKCGNSLIDDPAVAGEKAFKWKEEFPQVFKEKDKKAFHITTATHDSRTSDRMIQYKVREKRDNGTRPKADPVRLDNDEELLITKTVAEIVKEDQLNVLAYNICSDHMHIILVCEEEEVAPVMQKIKSKTARAVNIHRGVTIPGQDAGEKRGITQHSLWTQKFGSKEITDEKQLWNTIEYVKTNREKHELPAIEQGSMLPCLYQDYDYVFRKEYKGGFDVVIGNPPYIPAEYISTNEKEFFDKAFYSAFGRINLYPLFYEKAIMLTRDKGMIGLITPYTLLKNQYYISARKFILDKTQIENLIDFTGYTVFKDAAVDSIILILTNSQGIDNEFEIIHSVQDFPSEKFTVSKGNQQLIFQKADLAFDVKTNIITTNKLIDNTIKLNEVIDFNQGVITGNNKEFIRYKYEEGFKPLITGSHFNRYNLQFKGVYLVYDEERLHRPRKKKLFEADEKLLIRQTGSYPICSYDNQQFYTLDTVHNGIIINRVFTIKYLLCLLNSRFFKYLYNTSINEEGKIFAQVKIIYLNPLPVKIITDKEQQVFKEKADIMLEKNKESNELSESFTQFLQTKFPSININNKLQQWHTLIGTDFFKELTKQKIKLSLSEQQEWLHYFEEQRAKANNIQQIIKQTDSEIDAMVYQLYGLTDEDIKTVRGATTERQQQKAGE